MSRSVCLLIVMAAAAYAQSPEKPHFEVASIKPTAPERWSGPSGGKSGSGRVNMPNVTLQRCIMGAFGIGPNQIAGGPDWLNVDHFDILAKAETPVGDTELMVMLQYLLAERFNLTYHRESRPTRAYVLSVAKSGPKLEKSDSQDAITQNGRRSIDAKSITMPRFAEVLSRQMDLPVVDHTGLDGAFNLKLEWAADNPTANEDRLPIFTAIQQLGLRLSTEKVPIEVLVIDHAEKPTEN